MNWIPVSERLPTKEDYEPTGCVLIVMYDPNDPSHCAQYATASYDPTDGWWTGYENIAEDEVSHWCRIVTPGASSPCERCARLREALWKLRNEVDGFLSVAEIAFLLEKGEALKHIEELYQAQLRAEAALKEEDA